MSAYVIDYSDPLRNGFSIPAGGFNGPGGSSANTTLRLYGRGALEWGEAVNENLVRLAENFASASPPSIASTGQLWVEASLYYHDDMQSLLSGWYFYNLNSTATNKWTLIGGTGVIPSAAPLTPVEGQYYYATVSGDPVGVGTPLGTLYGFYSLGRYEPAAWVMRSYTTGSGAPTSSVRPRLTLRMFNATVNNWRAPSVVNITQGPAPTDPSPGMFWYNSNSGNLWIRTTSNTWQEILGPSNGSAWSIASGPVHMGDGTTNYQIRNLANPTSNQDAATKAYVDSAVGAAAGVTSFNTRTGAITLTSSDVTTALGFTPSSGGVSSFNTRTGAITLTSSDVTTALGFTPAPGTVTSVSVANANGVSATVTNPTTTPVLSFSLGAITPASVTTVGVLSTTKTTASTSKTTGALLVSGGAGISGNLWATNINATGNVTAAASDRRLKKDLEKINGAVAKVQQLTGYTYAWDLSMCSAAGFEFDTDRQVGVIAQDVQNVLPEAVAPAPANSNYLTVRYEKLVALLIEAIKEQADEISTIKQLLGK